MDTLAFFYLYLCLGIYIAAIVTHALTRVFAPPVQVVNQIIQNVIATREVLTHSKEVTLLSIDFECEVLSHLYRDQQEHQLRRTTAEMCHKLLHEMIRNGHIFLESREQRGYHGEPIRRIRIGTYINHLSQERHQPLADPWADDRPQWEPPRSGYPLIF